MEALSVSDIRDIHREVDRVLALADRHIHPAGEPPPFTDVPSAVEALESLLEMYSNLQGTLPDNLLFTTLHRIDTQLELLLALERTGGPPAVDLYPEIIRSGRAYQYNISKELLEEYLEYGMTTEGIALLLGVNASTIKRRRKEFDLGRQRTEIDDASLELVIRGIRAEGNENVGEVLLTPLLRDRGLFLPREQLRRVLRAVDPEGRQLRWMKAINRRRYSVPFPNSLWHIDGHHKLIRWGFVVHGCIDGKSRVAVYLVAATDNEAKTVKKAFLHAVTVWHWPSSFIQGRSVHNQRIERLWADIYPRKLHAFKARFEELEARNLLDPEDPINRWCIQLVYLPMLNRALQDFILQWNYHRLRTEKSTPMALWSRGAQFPSSLSANVA
ncbi:hypothetical protein JCM8115_002970 [Rhodotorula mucilaginosa]